jgi:D-alanyl-D-alanine carboxypeptidase
MLKRKLAAAVVLVTIAASVAFAGMFSDGGKEQLDAVVHSSTLSCTNVGIKVVALSSGKTLYAENGKKLFIPASNAKLATAYCALKILTPQYVFPTTFSTDAVVSSTTVRTLYVKGCGDPSVRPDDLKLQALALSGKFRHVAGDVVVDNSYFDAVPFGKGWMWDEGIDAYNAPISPWPVNGNCVDIFLSPGAKAGERYWQMPLVEEYRKDIDSVYADMTNTGSVEGGGIKSALFLREFVTVPWVHLDIAGTAYFRKKNAYAPAGATGVSHATLVELALAEPAKTRG